MKEALHYKKTQDRQTRCELCPHSCPIPEGSYGKCKVRMNRDGVLFSMNYGQITALHVDPVEKKPLYHFYPGGKILSIGSAGCNLHCSFCQNFEISQSPSNGLHARSYSPEDIIAIALKEPSSIGIAYTYNEPVVFFEFMTETAQRARENSLKNVVVSNGFINHKPLETLVEITDAFNIDLKSFSNTFYKEVSGGSLQPVLNTLKYIRSKNRHLEITHLLVPGLNDELPAFKKMTEWIAAELGAETVLHISRYFPRFRYNSPPTPLRTLLDFYETARASLHFVYLGNMEGPEGHDTVCPACGLTVIRRSGYTTSKDGMDPNGNCRQCGKAIAVNT